MATDTARYPIGRAEAGNVRRLRYMKGPARTDPNEPLTIWQVKGLEKGTRLESEPIVPRLCLKMSVLAI